MRNIDLFGIRFYCFVEKSIIKRLIKFAVLVVLTSVISAVGVCERSVGKGGPGETVGGNGGVYFLVAHVLGGQMGGAVGLVYCFGQVGFEINGLPL